VVQTQAYLDYNATAPVRPEVVEAVRRRQEIGGNPSSVHALGRDARQAVEDAREKVAALVHVRPQQIVFTSGGTESNNLALNGLGKRQLFVSAVEHGSVLAAALIGDPDAVVVPVDRAGRIDLGALESALVEKTGAALVSIMLANNETGVVNSVAPVANLAQSFSVAVHCDAIQAAGKIAVDFDDLGVDLMSLSAHKIGGPQGVGALVVADGVELAARVIGGGQERGLRAGTENVAGVVGFGVAAEICAATLEEFEKIGALRDGMEQRLRQFAPASRVIGDDAPRLPNTSCVTMPGVASETQVIALDLAGVAVSAGAACSSGKVARSHVLEAMGVADEIADCAIRVSLGWRTTVQDLDLLYDAWTGLYTHTHGADLAHAQPAA
jgi:cysteine desulfurase